MLRLFSLLFLNSTQVPEMFRALLNVSLNTVRISFDAATQRDAKQQQHRQSDEKLSYFFPCSTFGRVSIDKKGHNLM